MKRAIALVLTAAAVTALGLPTAASAEEWTDEGVAIQQNETVLHTGNWQISGGLAGTIQCQLTVEFTMIAGTGLGEVKKYEVDLDQTGQVTQKCATAGTTAFCQIHKMEALNLPWLIEIKEGGKHWHITSKGWSTSLTGAFCPTSSIVVTEGTVTGTPDSPSGVSSYEMSGTVPADINGSQTPTELTVGGGMNVLEPDTGTFGLF